MQTAQKMPRRNSPLVCKGTKDSEQVIHRNVWMPTGTEKIPRLSGRQEVKVTVSYLFPLLTGVEHLRLVTLRERPSGSGPVRAQWMWRPPDDKRTNGRGDGPCPHFPPTASVQPERLPRPFRQTPPPGTSQGPSTSAELPLALWASGRKSRAVPLDGMLAAANHPDPKGESLRKSPRSASPRSSAGSTVRARVPLS